jgi:hypothetical protein
MGKASGVIDLRAVEWNNIRTGSTPGVLPKATMYKNSKKYYLKMSSYGIGFGVYGCESVMELLAFRIAKLLGIDTLEYSVIRALVKKDGREFITPVSISEDFKPVGMKTIAFDKVHRAEGRPNESALRFACRMGWEDFIKKMLVLDYIIINMDRHGANIEVDLNSRKPLPLFDHGNSLLSHRTEKQIKDAKYDDNSRVNNYIGSQNLLENLQSIKTPVLINRIEPRHRAILFKGTGNLISRARRDTIWNLINGRIDHARKIQAIRFR